MLRDDECYELSGSSVIRLRQLYVLVRMDDGTEVWIPRAEIVGADELDEDSTDLSVRAGWAEREGII